MLDVVMREANARVALRAAQLAEAARARAA
jgi:hypothetical protein